jgi:hypothetical protein
LNVVTIDLSSNQNLTISNIDVEDSSVELLLIESIINAPASPVSLQITNISYHHSHFEYTKDLITFAALQTNEDIQVKIADVSFHNLVFERGGNLIKFQHQIKHPILMNNSIFRNITGGSVYIESLSKQDNSIATKIKFDIMTVHNINSEFSSFIQIYQGGDIEIHNSHFDNNFCFESGSIIFAGYQKSTTIIHNSVFENNAAVQGGVFNIESQSHIQCTN